MSQSLMGEVRRQIQGDLNTVLDGRLHFYFIPYLLDGFDKKF